MTYISPITKITRKRMLPAPVKVLVRKGQLVRAGDVVVESVAYPAHIMLDVAHSLGISRARAREVIEVQTGAVVHEGDILAGPVGLVQRVIRAPHNGKIILIRDGRIILQFLSHPERLYAGMPGEIIEIIDPYADPGSNHLETHPGHGSAGGVIIETTGVLLQGVWGNGASNYARLFNIITHPFHELTPDQVVSELQNVIVIAGHCEIPEAIQELVNLPVSGIILNSIAPALLKHISEIPIPIMVIEAFGQRSVRPKIHELINEYGRQPAALVATPWSYPQSNRPELVISLPTYGTIVSDVSPPSLVPNQLVRIHSAPHAGQFGRVDHLCGIIQMPNGLRAEAVQICLESQERAIVPLENLEIIRQV